jgi:thioredoxin-dependent peroxiredoxin
MTETQVQVGERVADFAAPATSGDITLAEQHGKTVVLYFYPKDSTPGCTTETREFGDASAAFEAANAIIFGVSRDSMKSHLKFREALGIPFDLISDPDEKLCTQFGVMKMKNMYGKKVRGIERSTFLIDGDGVLVKEWRGVRVPGHVDEVLAAVKTL